MKKRVCSLHIGEKFLIGTKKCIRLPEMVIDGHEAGYVVNYLIEGQCGPYESPIHIVDFISPQLEVEVV